MEMENDLCCLCGLKIDSTAHFAGDTFKEECKRCGTVIISREVTLNLENHQNKQVKSILSGITRYRKVYKLQNDPIYSTNLKLVLESSFVPKNISQKTDLILKYFEINSKYFGDPIEVNLEIDYPIGFCFNSSEFINYLDYLTNQNLLKTSQKGKIYLLDYRGWNRLDEQRIHNVKSRQAFIAMWFDESMNDVYLNGFHKAVKDSGYDPFRIDKKEHINKIDDEIIAEIKNSGFLIADFTGHRGGVYYEAGFAHGFGIPVIWTCKKNDLKDLHFDTRQYNHIDWETPEELYSKLINRIKATITINK